MNQITFNPLTNNKIKNKKSKLKLKYTHVIKIYIDNMFEKYIIKILMWILIITIYKLVSTSLASYGWDLI